MHPPFSLCPQIRFFISIFLTQRFNLWSSSSFFLNFLQKYTAHSHRKAGRFCCTLRCRLLSSDSHDEDMVSLGLCLGSAHQACTSSLGNTGCFDQDRQKIEPAWSHQLWQSHCGTVRRSQGHPDGTVKGKHSAGMTGIWPPIPTRSLDTWHQRSWAPSQPALTDGAWAWKTCKVTAGSRQVSGWRNIPCRQHQLQLNCFPTKRCANTFLFVYTVHQSCISFPEELKDWTHWTQPRFVCYQGGMNEGHGLFTPERLSLKPQAGSCSQMYSLWHRCSEVEFIYTKTRIHTDFFEQYSTVNTCMRCGNCYFLFLSYQSTSGICQGRKTTKPSFTQLWN